MKSEALRLANRLSGHGGLIFVEMHAAAAELRRLSAELERERMRLAACGVVALADTPDSAKHARQMHPDYESAACQDVARRVDECISLRTQRDALLEACRAMLTFIERHAPRGLQPAPGSPVAMARAAIKAVEEQK
jgi:hypothetical protein